MAHLAHRDQFLPKQRAVDVALEWITDNVLASRTLFIIALIVPLISLLPGLDWFQRIVIILSSNWFQLWALPALQRSQNQIQAKQDAKAEADHRNIQHILLTLEAMNRRDMRARMEQAHQHRVREALDKPSE